MKRLKDLCLNVLLNEGEDVFNISSNDVVDVSDVDLIDDNIRIKFETPYSKKTELVVKFNDFKNWTQEKKSKNLFKQFVVDFLENSNQIDDNINEIVDDNGEIDLDGDMPNNSNNTLVASPKFDLEKIYKSYVPKSIRFYSGSVGQGFIVW